VTPSDTTAGAGQLQVTVVHFNVNNIILLQYI
jgi:hypothetical protein